MGYWRSPSPKGRRASGIMYAFGCARRDFLTGHFLTQFLRLLEVHSTAWQAAQS